MSFFPQLGRDLSEGVEVSHGSIYHAIFSYPRTLVRRTISKANMFISRITAMVDVRPFSR